MIHNTNRTFLESGFVITIQIKSLDSQNESMDSQNESKFLQISYTIPASLVKIQRWSSKFKIFFVFRIMQGSSRKFVIVLIFLFATTSSFWLYIQVTSYFVVVYSPGTINIIRTFLIKRKNR